MARQYEPTETRRRQVAEAALQTIAEDGMAHFTTRAVAARVGISDGTLFRHFGSKEEVAIAALGILEAQIDEGLVSTGDPRTDLEQFFRHRAAFVGAQKSVGRLIFSDELVQLAGESGKQLVAHWRSKSVGYLLERLGALRMSGALRETPDVPAMSMLLQGALLTFAMQASLGRSGGEAQLNARIEHAWNALTIVMFNP